MNTLTPATMPVEHSAKLRFLPVLFSHDYVRAENNVFQYAARFLDGYAGGEWTFVRLPGGGGFMQPEEKAWAFSNPDNYAQLTLSAEAAGIVITALVLNHRSWLYDRHDQPALCEHYVLRHRQLMAFADAHAEAGNIFRALD